LVVLLTGGIRKIRGKENLRFECIETASQATIKQDPIPQVRKGHSRYQPGMCRRMKKETISGIKQFDHSKPSKASPGFVTPERGANDPRPEAKEEKTRRGLANFRVPSFRTNREHCNAPAEDTKRKKGADKKGTTDTLVSTRRPKRVTI